MTGGDMLPTAGVWWDLNSCPVPHGFDPRSVRWRIESAFRKMFNGPCSVTICALGNLDYVSPQVLREISSSGINIIHAICGGMNLKWFVKRWSEQTPPPAKILLISSNPLWFIPTLLPSGYTVLRAFPENHRASLLAYAYYAHYTPGPEECDWETFLKENSYEFVEEETSLNHVDEPGWSCFICEIDSFESCDSFVNHLKSAEHKQESFEVAAVDENGVPRHYCSFCEYPAYDEFNLEIHLNSAEHKRNLSIRAEPK